MKHNYLPKKHINAKRSGFTAFGKSTWNFYQKEASEQLTSGPSDEPMSDVCITIKGTQRGTKTDIKVVSRLKLHQAKY